MAADAHCTGCGRPSEECAGCSRPLDPPRHCPICGLRLAVLVTPSGHRGRCKVHGPVTADGTGEQGRVGH